MLIDGKKIAEEIKGEIKEQIEKSGKKFKLAIVAVAPNEMSKKFIERKVKFAEDIGVKTRIYDLPENISTSKLRKKMAEICHIKENDGVILQLPLPARNATHSVAGGPEHINTQYALNSIIPSKDVDVLSSRSFGDFATSHSKILPPVVAAIKEILMSCHPSAISRQTLDLKGKNVVIVGAGILVGKPVASWLMNCGATISIVNEFTPDISEFTKNADIIISGAGKKNLIKPDMVKRGVIVLDAAGDADPAIADKASLFTPAIGGIGPITVAMVFKNLISLKIKNT